MMPWMNTCGACSCDLSGAELRYSAGTLPPGGIVFVCVDCFAAKPQRYDSGWLDWSVFDAWGVASGDVPNLEH